MKASRTLASLATSVVLASAVGAAYTPALAATTKHAPGTVRAIINGKTVPAIAVGNTTYVNWAALGMFHTPYEYMGSGQFTVTGGTVQGVIYKGVTYIPWNQAAPQVKATHLKGGGFRFTSIPVPHDYTVSIFTQNGIAGTPDGVAVFVSDGSESVPNQTIKLTFDGTSYASNHTGQSTITVKTDSTGAWYGAINDTTAETVHPTAEWTDPSGHLDSNSQTITFASAAPVTPIVPPGSTVVATVPMSIFQNAILFNAQAVALAGTQTGSQTGSQSGTQAGTEDILFQLDTGAYEPLITKEVAQELNLPNLGSDAVQGVGGVNSAYDSQITLTIGGHTFNNIPCIVDDSYMGPSLFGYSFFTDAGYDLLVSQKTNTIEILK